MLKIFMHKNDVNQYKYERLRGHEEDSYKENEMSLNSNEENGNSKYSGFLEIIGLNGPWQRRLFFLHMLTSIPSSMNNMAVSFLAPNIDHWCAIPPGLNVTVLEWRNAAIPTYNSHCERYGIDAFKIDSSFTSGILLNSTVSCESWEYDHAVYSSTIVEEWDLVCSKDWLISLSKSMWMFGAIFSCIICGYLSDRFGRRKIMLFSNLFALIFSTATAFSNLFAMFIIFRFFVAFFTTSLTLTSYVLMMEVTSEENRNSFGVLSGFAWVFGIIVLPFVAWICRNWFWIQISNTLPLLLFLTCWWICPESPRWLLTMSKFQEVKEVLQKAAKINSVHHKNFDQKFQELVTETNQQNKSTKQDVNVLDILRVRDLRRKTFILIYVWIVVNFIYYGLTYNTNDLSGDPFLNFALYGLVEIPATVITYFIIEWFGRVKPLAVTLFVTGVMGFAIDFVPQVHPMLTTYISLAGKFLISMSFNIVILVTVEVFPTSLRNFSYGVCFLWGRLASLTAPFVREMSRVHPMAPQILYGILGTSSGIITFLLPETKDSMTDGICKETSPHRFRRNSKDEIKKKKESTVEFPKPSIDPKTLNLPMMNLHVS